MESYPRKVTVLTTPCGRYVWWPLLGIVDYIPKGKRSHTDVIFVRGRDATIADAVAAAARHAAHR